MDPCDYSSGYQMYGGAFYEPDYNQSQNFYQKGYMKKEGMHPGQPGPGGMYYQPQPSDWEFMNMNQVKGAQPQPPLNYQEGYPGNSYYPPQGKL